VAATQQDHSSAPTPVVNRTSRKRAPWPVEFYRSAVGKKWVMAVTGILLMGFVFAHMVGNLKAYLGPAEHNHYSEFLRDLAVPIFPRSFVLWAFFRLPLIAAFALHMHAAYTLTQMNHRARPAAYATERDYVAANFASRTMRWTGIIVILFLAWHLADLTWGWVNPDFVRGDAYNNMVNSFQRWPITLLYIVANLALGVHLFHGAWSLFQSLGINHPRFNQWRIYFARGFAAVIVLGNVSFPVLAQLKVIDYTPSERREVCEAAPAATRDGGPCRDVGA
jgi:succinate dehydrogenase / fumarate reductase cytochrome b subunit